MSESMFIHRTKHIGAHIAEMERMGQGTLARQLRAVHRLIKCGHIVTIAQLDHAMSRINVEQAWQHKEQRV